jgi:hypothetical protein
VHNNQLPQTNSVFTVTYKEHSVWKEEKRIPPRFASILVGKLHDMAYHTNMQNIWSEIQTHLHEQLDPGHFKVWIAPLKAECSLKDSGEISLTIFAPTEFVTTRVRERYLNILAKTASMIHGKNVELELKCGKPENPLPEAEFISLPARPRHGGQPRTSRAAFELQRAAYPAATPIFIQQFCGRPVK